MGLLQELQFVLTVEYERAQATPAMRLLDEVSAQTSKCHVTAGFEKSKYLCDRRYFISCWGSSCEVAWVERESSWQDWLWKACSCMPCGVIVCSHLDMRTSSMNLGLVITHASRATGAGNAG